MWRRRITVVIVAWGLAVAGCSRGADSSAETTVVVPTEQPSAEGDVTATEGTTATSLALVEGASEATTVAVVIGMPTYEVVEGGGDGETLVVVVEPGSYTNVELENMVYDIVERFAPEAAIVFDTVEAADLLVLEETTAEQQRFLDEHTLMRISNGIEVTFLGPYADIPALTIGS